MNTVKPSANTFLALTWAALAVAVIAAAIAALRAQQPYIMPGLLMMSVLLFMLSAQRTQRFAIEKSKFNKRMQFISTFTAILCGTSIALNTALF